MGSVTPCGPFRRTATLWPAPLAADGRWRDLHHLGGFFQRQAAEKAELHDATSRGSSPQPRERFVQCEQIDINGAANHRRILERHFPRAVAALTCAVRPRVIDEVCAASPGRNAEKVRPFLPSHRPLVDELQKGSLTRAVGCSG